MEKIFWIVLAGIMFLGLASGVSADSVPAATIASFLNTSNTLTTTTTLAGTTQTKTIEKWRSRKEVCRIMKGCWSENECFPYGYRTEDTYCGLNKKFKIRFGTEVEAFSNQSDTIGRCNNSFECKSNFCFKGECVDTLKTADEGVVRINKSDLKELRNIIGSAENSTEENYNENVSRNFLSSLIDLFKKMFGW